MTAHVYVIYLKIKMTRANLMKISSGFVEHISQILAAQQSGTFRGMNLVRPQAGTFFIKPTGRFVEQKAHA